MELTSNGDYRVQRMLPAEWEAYQTIRLEALQTNPEMFGSNYNKEVAYGQDDWILLLENDARAIFGLYHLEALIGLCGVMLRKGEETTAVFFSTFIGPAHRGKGLSKLFYEVRIAWAREKNCTLIVVSHRAGNELSKAANQGFGFKYTHANVVVWPDGTCGPELVYALQL